MNASQAAAPLGALLMRAAGAVVLVAYGVIGVVQDDVVIPTKRGTFHLHGLSGWTMAGAMFCAALALFAVVIDHYDRRDDDLAYKRFGKWTARLGWVLTGLAIGLNTAGVNFPEPSKLTPIGIFGVVMILVVVTVIGLANERAVERTAQPSLQVPGDARSQYRVGRAILGQLLMIFGALILLFALPGVFQFKVINYLITSVSVLAVVLGWLLFSSRIAVDIQSPAPSTKKFRHWRAIRIGLLLVAGLWAIWYIKSSQWGEWRDDDEAERKRAPAWNYRLDEFAAGIPLPVIKDRLSAEGFRMRCYGNLEKHEKIEPDDIEVCWTIANNIEGIPSRMITFFFGPNGLRHIRLDFPESAWPAVKEWHKRQGDLEVGNFGRDQGGSKILGRRGKSGLVLASEPGMLNWVMVMWQSRELIQERNCDAKEHDQATWQLLCKDWPPFPGPSPFLNANPKSTPVTLGRSAPPT